jgi:hypothetical protein
MIDKYYVLTRCFLYATKVWLVNFIFLIIFLYYTIKIDFLVLSALVGFSLIHNSILTLLTFYLIYKRLNHWLKKILLVALEIISISIVNILIFRDAEIEDNNIAYGLSLVLSIPTLITIGLFYSDKLDEDLRK